MRGLLCLPLLILFACETITPPTATAYLDLSGETMGTYYRVKYLDSGQGNLKPAIDSLLLHLNTVEVSTYEPNSLITRFNRATEQVILSIDGPAATAYPHFVACYDNAATVTAATDGTFDPTIMPLVNYWGFGYDGRRQADAADSTVVDSLMRFVGFAKVRRTAAGDTVLLRKALPGVQLDFSANAKGYGVDAVGRLLEARGIDNYLVEIGGEDRARGKNDRGGWWTVGVNTPSETASVRDFERVVALRNYSIATSGNYRNFYEKDGQKVSHIINPKTGYPERRNLLSASVFAPDCMTADAYATACMVLGTERALALIESLPGVEALLIYGDAAGDFQQAETSGLAALVSVE